MYQRPSRVATSDCRGVSVFSTVVASVSNAGSVNVGAISARGRPTSEGIRVKSRVTAAVNRRIRRWPSRKTIVV